MIYLVNKNESLINRIKEKVKDNFFLTILHGDIFEVAKEKKALIGTASNPGFVMVGGLDAEIAKRFPDEVKDLKKFNFTKNLAGLVTVGDDRKATKKRILECLFWLFGHKNKDIVISCLGCGIGGFSEGEFIDMVKNFSESDFRRSNFRRSDFSWSDFRESDFSWSDFRRSDFCRSNFRRSNFRRSNFSWSDFCWSNFRRSDFRRSDFRWSDFSESDFRRSDFRESDFRELDFSESNFRRSNFSESIGILTIVPEGEIVGWKKCEDDIIVKLLIPKEAKRSSGTTRKCRAEYVKVLEVIGAEKGISLRDKGTKYKKDEIIKCDKWDDNRWNECSGGIHFFLTRQEAESYRM